MAKATIKSALLVLVVILVMAVYVSIQLYYRSERLNLIESQQKKIATLKNKLYWSRRANNFSLVLPKILNPCELCELAAWNEALRQKIIREYNRRE